MKLPTLMDTKHISPLDEETAQIFAKCCLLNEDIVFEQKQANELAPSGLILYQRLQMYGGQINLGVAILVTVLAKGVPGNLVMYA